MSLTRVVVPLTPHNRENVNSFVKYVEYQKHKANVPKKQRICPEKQSSSKSPNPLF